MVLDELQQVEGADDADDLLLVTRDEHRVITDKDSHRGLLGDLTQLHGLHDDRTPVVVTHPRDIPGLGVTAGDVENRHNSVVAQHALDSC